MLNSSTFRQIPTSNPEEGVWNYMGLLTSSDYVLRLLNTLRNRTLTFSLFVTRESPLKQAKTLIMVKFELSNTPCIAN